MSDSSRRRRLLAVWHRAAASSRSVRTLQRVGQRTGAAVESSTLSRGCRVLDRWVRASWLYRWLTAEPDTDVVVIDLRESYAAGPVLAVLDSLGGRVTRQWEHATSRTVLSRLGESTRDAPIRVAGLLVATAVATNLALGLAVGSPSGTGVVVRVVLLVSALLGTRVTGETLRTARTVRALRYLLGPSGPPATSDDKASDDNEADDKASDDRR